MTLQEVLDLQQQGKVMVTISNGYHSNKYSILRAEEIDNPDNYYINEGVVSLHHLHQRYAEELQRLLSETYILDTSNIYLIEGKLYILTSMFFINRNNTISYEEKQVTIKPIEQTNDIILQQLRPQSRVIARRTDATASKLNIMIFSERYDYCSIRRISTFKLRKYRVCEILKNHNLTDEEKQDLVKKHENYYTLFSAYDGKFVGLYPRDLSNITQEGLDEINKTLSALYGENSFRVFTSDLDTVNKYLEDNEVC